MDRLTVRRRRDPDERALVGVLDRVVEEVADRRDQLAAFPDDRQAGAGLGHLDANGAQLGRGTNPLNCFRDHEVHGHDLSHRRPLDLDATQLEKVVDSPTDAVGFVHEALGETFAERGIVFGEQRLGQQRERPDRRLELMADVRDEVRADSLEPGSLRDVVDRGERSDSGAVALQR